MNGYISEVECNYSVMNMKNVVQTSFSI